MSNIVPFQPQAALPAVIAQQLATMGAPTSNPLSEGVGASFAVVSFKGKVFRIRHGGTETMILDPQTGQPMQAIEVVIIDAKPLLSKTFYATGFVEGSNEQPDCASEDGITPHAPPGKQVQSPDCRTCPWNAFGSKKSTDGTTTNSKACADTRKLAIVPAQDIGNERYGGPMLLRIPAASLTGLAEFDRTLRATGAPFYAVVAQVSFDFTVAYPKLIFKPLRFISDAEATQVLALRGDLRTREIIDGIETIALPAPVAGTLAPVLAGGPVTQMVAQAPQLAPPPVQQQQPVQAPQPHVQAPQQPPAFNAFATAPAVAPPSIPVVAPTIPVTAVAPPAVVSAFGPPGQPVVQAVAAVPQSLPPAVLPASVLSHVDTLLAGG